MKPPGHDEPEVSVTPDVGDYGFDSRHDGVNDDLPDDAFDLVCCRLLLAHLPARQRAVDRMIDATKPGGWGVVEEMDFGSSAVDGRQSHADSFLRTIQAHDAVLRVRGFGPEYGRRVVGDLRRRGLEEVDAGATISVCVGGGPAAEAWRLTFEQLRHDLVASGADTQDVSRAILLTEIRASAFCRRRSSPRGDGARRCPRSDQ